MRTVTRNALGLGLSFALAAAIGASAQKNAKDGKSSGNDKPKLSLVARPNVAIAPARVVLTAELAGGADDYQDYYCPSITWEWGDLSSSEQGADCPPYEAGKTTIKRRFTVEHNFDHQGSYKVYFKMMHGSKEIASTSVTVRVQPGTNDFDQ
ncbi:MAG TPA: hypothetical protein VHZ73_12970 [Vicinamibacterales bacterium]|jgi:hypothetical protein|nr:hypothetical protein [Vicinamibacterales bacterium]